MVACRPSFLWLPVALIGLWQIVAFDFNGDLSLMASCRSWQVVAHGKLSLMASCRSWQVVAHGNLSFYVCELELLGVCRSLERFQNYLA